MKRIKENSENIFVLKDRYYYDKKGMKKSLWLSDLTLHVEIERGAEVETDLTCNSTFMVESIFEIECTIPSSFCWVPHDIPVHLHMDNVGGHGTSQTKREYVRI